MTSSSNPSDSALLRQLASDMAVVRAVVQDIRERDTDHEARLRVLERAPKPDDKTASRLTRLERWQYVAFGAIVATAGGGAAALSQVMPSAS